MSKAPLEQSNGMEQDPAKQGTSQSLATTQNAKAPTGDISAAQTLMELEQFMYLQFLYYGGFDWKTTDNPGTKLFQVEMHPKSNPITNFLSPIFNAWQGGIDVQTNVAGTGFNGGKLLVAFIPPNIDDKLYNLTDYTYYPYLLMDPKAQGAMTHPGTDERNVYFHWMEEFTDKFGKITMTGGKMVFVVFQKLTIANMQNQSINVAVSTRASSDFMFAQPIPPKLKRGVPTAFKLELGQTDPFNHTGRYSNLLISTRKVENYVGVDFLVNLQGETRVPKYWEINAGATDTVKDDFDKIFVDATCNPTWATAGKKSEYAWFSTFTGVTKFKCPRLCFGKLISAEDTQTFDDCAGAVFEVPASASVATGIYSKTNGACTASIDGQCKLVGIWNGTTSIAHPTKFSTTNNQCSRYNANYAKYCTKQVSGMYTDSIRTANNETIVYFANKFRGPAFGEAFDCTTVTEEIRQQLLSLPFTKLGADETPLFDVKESETGISLFRVRLNRGGFFSTTLSKSYQVALDTVELVYFATVKYYERIPDSGPNLLALAVADMQVCRNV